MQQRTLLTAGVILCVAIGAALGGIAIDPSAPGPTPIKNVVVLMMENRSFDHIFGYYAKEDPRINGLKGDECIPKDLTDHSKGVQCVSDEGYEEGPDDPCHSHECTTLQIYGTMEPAAGAKPTMNGFVDTQTTQKQDPSNVMRMFNSTTVPIITTLAKEFVLFDNFFASFPGCTYPNRAFVHSGTSAGHTDNDVPEGGWPQPLIYDKLTKAGKTWKMYYHDSMDWAIFLGGLRTDEAKKHIFKMDQFYADAAAGTLPDYAFIEPRISADKDGPANTQHPDASMKAGEQLIKDVYESVRASPQWNDTLYIVTYDEHGGFYDHVAPPQDNVPNPDGLMGKKNGFDFKRLGVRIPTLLVSPWVNKGVLESKPRPVPTPTSQYDLTSILATVKIIFGLDSFMTARDAWASPFEHLLTARSAAGMGPRTDCPEKLPETGMHRGGIRAVARAAIEMALPPNDNQIDLMEQYCLMLVGRRDCHQTGRPRVKSAGFVGQVRTQGDVTAFLRAAFEDFMAVSVDGGKRTTISVI